MDAPLAAVTVPLSVAPVEVWVVAAWVLTDGASAPVPLTATLGLFAPLLTWVMLSE